LVHSGGLDPTVDFGSTEGLGSAGGAGGVGAGVVTGDATGGGRRGAPATGEGRGATVGGAGTPAAGAGGRTRTTRIDRRDHDVFGARGSVTVRGRPAGKAWSEVGVALSGPKENASKPVAVSARSSCGRRATGGPDRVGLGGAVGGAGVETAVSNSVPSSVVSSAPPRPRGRPDGTVRRRREYHRTRRPGAHRRRPGSGWNNSWCCHHGRFAGQTSGHAPTRAMSRSKRLRATLRSSGATGATGAT